MAQKSTVRRADSRVIPLRKGISCRAGVTYRRPTIFTMLNSSSRSSLSLRDGQGGDAAAWGYHWAECLVRLTGPGRSGQLSRVRRMALPQGAPVTRDRFPVCRSARSRHNQGRGGAQGRRRPVPRPRATLGRVLPPHLRVVSRLRRAGRGYPGSRPAAISLRDRLPQPAATPCLPPLRDDPRLAPGKAGPGPARSRTARPQRSVLRPLPVAPGPLLRAHLCGPTTTGTWIRRSLTCGPGCASGPTATPSEACSTGCRPGSRRPATGPTCSAPSTCSASDLTAYRRSPRSRYWPAPGPPGAPPSASTRPARGHVFRPAPGPPAGTSLPRVALGRL